MSVAENPVTERLPRHPQQQLAINSAIGAVIVLAGLWFLFAAVPILWSHFWDGYLVGSNILDKNDFLSGALLILISLAVTAGLCLGAYRLAQTQKQPGVRAGIVVAALALFLVCWICVYLGELLDAQFEENPTLGWIVLGLIMAALLAGVGYLFVAVPAWAGFLETVDEQGWFNALAYKGNQGVRVRRGTIMGILAIGVCGIIALVQNQMFGTERSALGEWGWVVATSPRRVLVPFSNDWFWIVPYTNKETLIPLMFKSHIIMPIVLGVLLFWFAWRVVNVPAFADFLIATEAEMNKVSWTSRPRLFQDTIVVLVTVFLFTGFLFFVDILWIQLLQAPGIRVLQVDIKQEQQKQQEKAQW